MLSDILFSSLVSIMLISKHLRSYTRVV